MSVLGAERSGSGPYLFRAGRFIPGGGPSSVARGARGAGADARFGDTGRARMPALGYVLRAVVLMPSIMIFVGISY